MVVSADVTETGEGGCCVSGDVTETGEVVVVC